MALVARLGRTQAPGGVALAMLLASLATGCTLPPPFNPHQPPGSAPWFEGELVRRSAVTHHDNHDDFEGGSLMRAHHIENDWPPPLDQLGIPKSAGTTLHVASNT